MALVKRVVIKSTTSYAQNSSHEDGIHGASMMKQALLEVATSLASLLGLVVIEHLTKDYTYGSVYFIGESEDSDHPLLCIGNHYPSHSSYWYKGYYISLCASGPSPTIALGTNYTSSVYNPGYSFILQSSGKVKFTLSYIETNDLFVFRLDTVDNGTFMLTRMSNSTDELKVCLMLYNGYIYYSHCPITNTWTSVYCLQNTLRFFVPITREAMSDFYGLQGYKLNALKSFSNRSGFKFGSIISINGIKYQIVFYVSDYITLLTQIE